MSEFLAGCSLSTNKPATIARAINDEPLEATHAIVACAGCNVQTAVPAAIREFEPTVPVLCEKCGEIALALGFEP